MVNECVKPVLVDSFDVNGRSSMTSLIGGVTVATGVATSMAEKTKRNENAEAKKKSKALRYHIRNQREDSFQ
jgi:hypothetical protein